MCLRCQRGENDPKFDLNVYMPKIWHSGFTSRRGEWVTGGMRSRFSPSDHGGVQYCRRGPDCPSRWGEAGELEFAKSFRDQR